MEVVGMPFVKGQSGNPRGRPRKGRSVTEMLERIGRTKRAGAAQTRLEELLVTLFEMGLNGDVAATRVLLAYLEGRPIERVVAQVGPMAPFTADEAAAAECELAEFRAGLVLRAAAESGAD